MRLQKIALRGFQSYVEQQIVDIDEHVTLLAGRNNVGKSALLRALQLPINRQEGVSPDFALTYVWSVSAEDIRATGGPSASDPRDWMLGGGDPQELVVDYAGAPSGGAIGAGELQVAGVRVPGLEATSRGIGGGWDQERLRTNMHEGALNTFVHLSDQASRRVLYLAPRRVEQGRQQLSRSTVLFPEARNLTDVLLYLSLNHRFGVFEQVEQVMKDAFPGIHGVSVLEVSNPGGGSQLQGEPMVYFEGRAEPVPLRLCGAGLEQMLALAVGVLTAEGSLLVLIDEPQAYLHPHAERALLSLLAAHPEHQFIIATHSHTLLGSQPLSRVRLLSLSGGETSVAQVEDQEQVLEGLGVTAADLWLVDRLVWVEGPSDQRVFEMIAVEYFADDKRSTLAIRAMPEASRFAAKSPRQADAAYAFCTTVARAIAPAAVRMLFVFDSDEKSLEFKERLGTASKGRAAFLPCRELENLFLDAELIQRTLVGLCGQADIEAPSVANVAASLDALLASSNDRELFPSSLPEGSTARLSVRATALLRRLWQELATAEYDKVRDGERLARAALDTKPEALKPLVELLDRIVNDDP